MPKSLVYGPIPTIPANTPVQSPALTIDAPDTTVLATADLAAQPAGITYDVGVEYRKTAGDPWRKVGGVGGVTTGGPVTDRQGNVVETGVRVSPIPDVGSTGRQIRATATVSATMTNVSGHVTTS